MSMLWKGKGKAWGHPEEKPCRPHDWTTMDPEAAGGDRIHACRNCHVRQCATYSTYGRCQMAVDHPVGTFHRYPDLMSEPVRPMLDA